MPVYELTDEIILPHPSNAEPDGLLAVGGDLTPERLVLAYSNGIFPWPIPEYPLLWWSPDPRAVFMLDDIRISKSLRLLMKKNKFRITFDTCFEDVVRACAKAKRNDEGTWITDDITDAYIQLHKLGIAHSVEAFCEDKLVGGLYGVSIGKLFTGESMFHTVTDASKIAFAYLAFFLKKYDFPFIDGQLMNNHLANLRFTDMPRNVFLETIQSLTEQPGLYGNWGEY